jgi:glucosamine-6-phosphate deaminase
MSKFNFRPSQWVPFKDLKAIERVRKIKMKDLTRHKNPDFKIRVLPAADIEMLWVADLVARLKQSAVTGEKVVMILPNPCPTYRHVATMVNRLKISCKYLVAFAMDEYANEKGDIAPETWRYGFTYAMKDYFWSRIDPELRPKESNFVGFTNKNIKDYGKLIEDEGDADICYSGPGWTGHLAFIEPDAPEFKAKNLKEWMKMGPRVCTLSPFTLAQNSLHGSFGMSGDLAAVPPKAATIGPAQVIASRHRIDVSSISVHGTTTAWQRMIARLCLHGPVTPLLPTSIHQLLRTDSYVSDVIARNIEPDWEKGY